MRTPYSSPSPGAPRSPACAAPPRPTPCGAGAPTRVLDYATTDPTEGEEQYDAVIDIAGGADLPRLRRVLTPRGSLVFVGDETGGSWTGGFGRPMRWTLRMLFAKQRFVMISSREKSPEDLERLARHLADGDLRAPVHAVRSLTEVRDAMRELAAGKVAGKTAIAVRSVE